MRKLWRVDTNVGIYLVEATSASAAGVKAPGKVLSVSEAATEHESGVFLEQRKTVAIKTRSGADVAISLIAKVFGVRRAALLSASRSKHLVIARWGLMMILRDLGYSYPEAGRELGMHHSSVMNGVRQFKNLILKQPDMINILDLVRGELNQLGYSLGGESWTKV